MYTAFVSRFQLDNTNYNRTVINILSYIVPNFHINWFHYYSVSIIIIHIV